MPTWIDGRKHRASSDADEPVLRLRMIDGVMLRLRMINGVMLRLRMINGDGVGGRDGGAAGRG
ncbi:hypothetical protein ACIB24_16140 [Spongisporangium articulatum]|uniref:Uncharacterized protein n=1 Tax=Spongisporangium articulatum TaxID=3362603 RepID=A0ABW8AQI4_9ACTN